MHWSTLINGVKALLLGFRSRPKSIFRWTFKWCWPGVRLVTFYFDFFMWFSLHLPLDIWWNHGVAFVHGRVKSADAGLRADVAPWLRSPAEFIFRTIGKASSVQWSIRPRWLDGCSYKSSSRYHDFSTERSRGAGFYGGHLMKDTKQRENLVVALPPTLKSEWIN